MQHQFWSFKNIVFAGGPLLYMGLCVPLGFTLYPEADYGYGYVQVTNSTQDNETTTQQTAVWVCKAFHQQNSL